MATLQSVAPFHSIFGIEGAPTHQGSLYSTSDRSPPVLSVYSGNQNRYTPPLSRTPHIFLDISSPLDSLCYNISYWGRLALTYTSSLTSAYRLWREKS